jgi:membrane protein
MAKRTSWLRRIRATALALWDESIFRSGGELSRVHKFIHFWVLVGRSFVRNRCPIRAAALSYTALLALIPMLAVAISVTSSLLQKEGEERIYQFIDRLVSSVMPPAVIATNAPAPASLWGSPGAFAGTTPGLATNEMPSAAAGPPGGTNAALAADGDARVVGAQKEAARRIHEFVQNTRSATLAGVGMLVLVYMAIQMLSQIEGTFNDIWGVTRGRNWLVRIVLYWTTITLGPLLLTGALGLAGGPHLQTTQKLISRMPVIGHFIFPALTLVLIWLTFALLYQLVPNTRVRFSAALVGGIIGGTLWQVNNVFGFLYVSRVVTNSKIYGSLGLLPVFMAGLYFSWLILLFGAQVAYAFQNRSLYLQEKFAENVNQRGREFVALRLMTCLGQRFQRGLPPVTIEEMSAELGIPSRLAQQVLHTLIAAHLVIEISGEEPAYTPARPLESINAHHVLQAMRATPGQELLTRDEPVREEVYGEFARIQEAEKQVASSVTLLALVHRAQARLEIAAPPRDGDEIKLKPALVPSIEPGRKPSTPPAVPPTADDERKSSP